MKKTFGLCLAATALPALLGWKFWSAGILSIGRDASSPIGDGSGATAHKNRIRWENDPSRQTKAEDAPSAPSPQATKEDQDLLEQDKRIAKLRKLNEALESGTYRVEHLAIALSSDEGMWLKAAYLQAAWDAKWTNAEADRALAEALSFLAELDPATNPDTMTTRAYHISMQLMASLNRRGDGKYDDVLKERFEKTDNPDYLKTIYDTPYKLEKLPSVPPQHAVAIVRESPTNEYVDYAKSLLGSKSITAEDRGDLNKYLTQHGSKSEWTASPTDDRQTKLMKLNGIAASKTSGKVQFIYRQWQALFFSKIIDDMSYSDWRALPNPTHELAQALWTEEDHSARKKTEEEILGLMKRHQLNKVNGQNQRKQRALVNLAVAYLDLCLSNLVLEECREQMAKPRSFAATLARDHLAGHLKRPDAAMVLGTTKAYVEHVTGDTTKP